MQRAAFALLLLVGVCLAEDPFTCGSDQIQTGLASTIVKFNCAAQIKQINSCCSVHDKCYEDQKGRTNCDNAFCGCVKDVAKSNPICAFYMNTFCDTARLLGEGPYQKVKLERQAAKRNAPPPPPVMHHKRAPKPKPAPKRKPAPPKRKPAPPKRKPAPKPKAPVVKRKPAPPVKRAVGKKEEKKVAKREEKKVEKKEEKKEVKKEEKKEAKTPAPTKAPADQKKIPVAPIHEAKTINPAKFINGHSPKSPATTPLTKTNTPESTTSSSTTALPASDAIVTVSTPSSSSPSSDATPKLPIGTVSEAKLDDVDLTTSASIPSSDSTTVNAADVAVVSSLLTIIDSTTPSPSSPSSSTPSTATTKAPALPASSVLSREVKEEKKKEKTKQEIAEENKKALLAKRALTDKERQQKRASFIAAMREASKKRHQRMGTWQRPAANKKLKVVDEGKGAR